MKSIEQKRAVAVAGMLLVTAGLAYLLVRRSGGAGARELLQSIRRKNSGNQTMNFDERITHLRRKIDQMWKASPSIVTTQC